MVSGGSCQVSTTQVSLAPSGASQLTAEDKVSHSIVMIRYHWCGMLICLKIVVHLATEKGWLLVLGC